MIAQCLFTILYVKLFVIESHEIIPSRLKNVISNICDNRVSNFEIVKILLQHIWIGWYALKSTRK